MPTEMKPMFPTKAELEKVIAFLETVYPENYPPVDMPLDMIRFKSGQVSVVRYLRVMLQDYDEYA